VWVGVYCGTVFSAMTGSRLRRRAPNRIMYGRELACPDTT